MKKYLILVLCAMLSVGLVTGCGSKKEDKDKNKIERKDGYTEGTIDLGSYENKMIMEATGNSYHNGDTIKVGPGAAVLSFDNDKLNYVCAEEVCTSDEEISNLYKIDIKTIPGIKFKSYFIYNGKKYNYVSQFTFKVNDPIKIANNYGNQNVSIKMVVEDFIKPYLENNLSNYLLDFAEKNGVDNITRKYVPGGDKEPYFIFGDYYKSPSELDNFGISLYSISIESVDEA